MRSLFILVLSFILCSYGPIKTINNQLTQAHQSIGNTGVYIKLPTAFEVAPMFAGFRSTTGSKIIFSFKDGSLAEVMKDQINKLGPEAGEEAEAEDLLINKMPALLTTLKQNAKEQTTYILTISSARVHVFKALCVKGDDIKAIKESLLSVVIQ